MYACEGLSFFSLFFACDAREPTHGAGMERKKEQVGREEKRGKKEREEG